MLSIIDTANMNSRSFKLNFEVNVLLYNKPLAKKLRQVLFTDIKDAEKINAEFWCEHSVFKQLPRMFSPVF